MLGEQRLDTLTGIYENIIGSEPPNIQELIIPESQHSLRSNSPRSSQIDLGRELSKHTSVYSTNRPMDHARDVFASVSEYHNRFLIRNLQMKWNIKVRDAFNDYLALSQDEKTASLSMSREAVELVQGIVKKMGVDPDDSFTEPKKDPHERFTKCGNVIDDFDEYLCSLDSDEHEIEYKYLVKLIRPQIQLQANSDSDSCVVKTSRDIELRVLGVNIAGRDDIIVHDEQEVSLVMKRYGVIFRDSFVFAFHKKNFPDLAIHPYGVPGQRQSWPPWVDIEGLR